MTKTKKQKRQEAGLEQEDEGVIDWTHWASLAIILGVLVGLIWLIGWLFPSYDLFSDFFGAFIPDWND